jgi:hypothetical protein
MKVGKVTHYYDKLGVAIVEVEGSFKASDALKFSGHGVDFEQQPPQSIQVDHKAAESAEKGEVVGLKVTQEVREGTEVEKV